MPSSTLGQVEKKEKNCVGDRIELEEKPMMFLYLGLCAIRISVWCTLVSSMRPQSLRSIRKSEFLSCESLK